MHVMMGMIIKEEEKKKEELLVTQAARPKVKNHGFAWVSLVCVPAVIPKRNIDYQMIMCNNNSEMQRIHVLKFEMHVNIIYTYMHIYIYTYIHI